MKRIVILLSICAAAYSVYAGGIVCNQDLTKQTSGTCAKVSGGTFKDGGWINSGGGKVVYTAPSKIDKGWAQISFIVDDISTSLQNQDKCIFFAIYDCAAMSQGSCAMKAYVRIRRESSRAYYLEFKARDTKLLHGEGETRLNTRNDWKKYYGKEVHIKFLWGPDRIITMEYPKQDGSGQYATVKRGDYNITNIKYIVVGSEGSYHCTFTGFRYTNLQVYDESASGDQVAVQLPANASSYLNARNCYSISGDKIIFSLKENETASVYDLRGKMIRLVDFSSSSIGADELTSGQYFITVSGAGAVDNIPLLIK